jgi:hypothetical protein
MANYLHLGAVPTTVAGSGAGESSGHQKTISIIKPSQNLPTKLDGTKDLPGNRVYNIESVF